MNAQIPFDQDNDMRNTFQNAFENEKVPSQTQANLEELYSSLKTTPQVRMTTVDIPQGREGRKQKVVRRGLIAAIVVAALALVGCTAYAIDYLLKMEPNEVEFFEGDSHPVYDSLKPGVTSLNATVGVSQTVGKTTITFDSVSTDRNIINLFFTVEREDGIDFDSIREAYDFPDMDGIIVPSSDKELASYLNPWFEYTISGAEEVLDEGRTNSVDAYLEDGKIKCMARIVPCVTLPDYVEIGLKTVSDPFSRYVDDIPYDPETGFSLTEPHVYSVELDLSTVDHPQELGPQELVFDTEKGRKTLKIDRFTVSDFGIAVAVRDHYYITSVIPDDWIEPFDLRISDETGAVLNPVRYIEDINYSERAYVYELSGKTPEGSITFTPMLRNENPSAPEYPYYEKCVVSEVGAKIPTSDQGGYEVVDKTQTEDTMTIKLHPYGWVNERNTIDFNPHEGEPYSEPLYQLSSRNYLGHDPLSGDLMVIYSFDTDKAPMPEIVYCHVSPDYGVFYEDKAAAITFPLQSSDE